MTLESGLRFFLAMAADDIAVIADVHGNAWALEAVLRDLRGRGVKSIINLGDDANGPLDPARSVELLRNSGAVNVRGNGDRMTGEGGAGARRSTVFARERLDQEALRWLRERPTEVRGDGWLAFHGTPQSDVDYFLENVSAGNTTLASLEEITSRLGSAAEGVSLVLCGHTHVPRLIQLATGVVIVNPGSVGLAAYADNDPSPHVVQNGSPHARYAIMRRVSTQWRAEFVSLPYDWNAAGSAARVAGWMEWAKYVETGYA